MKNIKKLSVSIISFILCLQFSYAQDCNKDYDHIVVGAGAAGMKAATELAKNGLKVLVLEKTANYGGKLVELKSKRIANGERYKIRIQGREGLMFPEEYADELHTNMKNAGANLQVNSEVVKVSNIGQRKFRVDYIGPNGEACYESKNVVVSTGKEEEEFYGIDPNKVNVKKAREDGVLVESCATCITNPEMFKTMPFVGKGKKEEGAKSEHSSVLDMANAALEVFKEDNVKLTLVLTDEKADEEYSDEEKAKLEELRKQGHKIIFADAQGYVKTNDGPPKKYDLQLESVRKIYDGEQEGTVPQDKKMSLDTSGLMVMASKATGNTKFLSESDLKDTVSGDGLIDNKKKVDGLLAAGDVLQGDPDDKTGGFAKAERDGVNAATEIIAEASKDSTKEFETLMAEREAFFKDQQILNAKICSGKLDITWNALETNCKVEFDKNKEDDKPIRPLKTDKEKSCIAMLKKVRDCKVKVEEDKKNPLTAGKDSACCEAYLKIDENLFKFNSCKLSTANTPASPDGPKPKETYDDLYAHLLTLKI